MYNKYKILAEFICMGKQMLIIDVNGNAHVLEKVELDTWFSESLDKESIPYIP